MPEKAFPFNDNRLKQRTGRLVPQIPPDSPRLHMARNFLYPVIARHLWLPMSGYALLGALIAGGYGILHDQITYAISPEYFMRMKFVQFAYTRPAIGGERLFVAVIGFLATWWVGFIAGWLTARLALPKLGRERGGSRVRTGYILIFGGAFLGGLLGALVGAWENPEKWFAYAIDYELDDAALPRFILVARIHLGGYAGALAGLVAALTRAVKRP